MTSTAITTSHGQPLYALADAYLAVLDLFDDEDSDPAAIEQALDQIGTDITLKADNIAALIKQFELSANARMEEVERMKKLASLDGSRADRLRNYLLNNLSRTGATKVVGKRFTLNVRDNPPAVQVLDQDQIPGEFIRVVTTTSVDKRAILDHFKQTGEILDGTDITRGQRLEIK